ncbi:MAG: TonB-dependent receptor [Acidobacteriota bacterium]|nr:TonB-dependent receptor [Acidobacteriota bacterium]
MSLRLHFFIHFLIALVLAFASLVGAHAQTAAPAPAATATLHGHVTDQTGALIPGADVIVTTATGTAAKTVKADASGAYEVRGLAPGGYIVRVEFAGFSPFQSQTIEVAAGQVKRVDVSMAIETAQQNVVVTDETPTVNIEAGGNANTVIIKGKDLDALSDDPDELSNELSALAGPSAGPNGGQIYIDGFTGGQLPPKSAIREIRINQNPFSAEFDRLGYGRIEILTKPGTDKLHGQVFIQGNQSSFNTGNPFTPNVPAYYRLQYNGSVSGSLGKKASFFMSMEQRDIQNQQVYNYYPSVLNTATGLYETASALTAGALANPHNHINVSPRIDLQLGKNDTLTLRYQFYYDSESGDISNTQLPTQSVKNSSTEHTFQLSDSHIINDRTVNETRIEYRRGLESVSPVSTDPTIIVSGNFTGGGASSQSSNTHSDHLELQNFTTMSLGAHALKFGTWLRDNREAISSFANRNGTLVFTQNGYNDALLKLANGQNLNTLGTDLVNLSITAGRAAYTANVFDGSLFVQDDWRVSPRLTLSGGLRWETQNHIADHNDWAPRVALAYALDAKKGKPTKTVLRAGYGTFYDRLGINHFMNATQQSVDSGQVQITTPSASCLNGTSFTNIDFSACLPAAPYTATPESTIVQIAPDYHSPYTHQFGTSIERQLTKTTTLTVTYLRSFGVHQLVTRNANAYLPGTYLYGSSTLTGVRPNPSLGIVQEYYPEAVYKQNQMIANFNARISPNFSIFGFYNLSFANTDGAGGTVSNSYNLSQDYGRAQFVSRNMAFIMGNYQGPWGLRFNPFMIVASGRPFNMVSGQDLTGDNFINDRPGIADSSLCAPSPTNRRYIQTQFGCFDLQPVQGETLLPMNYGNSPSSIAVNLRISRAIGIGPKVEGTGQNGGPPFGGGGPRGGRGPGGGGPGGGLGPGGLGGGGRPPGMFGPQGASRKYNLTFTAQALNLFNNVNYGTPTGTITPTAIFDTSGNVTGYGPPSFFNRSRGLAGRIFSQGPASRRIFVQAIFSF